MKKMKKLRPIVVLLVGWLVLSGCVSKCFYYPTSKVYQTPKRYKLKYEDVTFQSKDETKLTGWFIPAIGKPLGTVIHFHGNAENMTSHFSFVNWLPKDGFNLFVFDYRGYGQSEGRITRRGIYEDSAAAIKYVQSRKDVDPNKILILGQSLGGANAIAAIGNNQFEGIRAVAIESAFSSYRLIVRDKIKEIPVLSFLRWPLSFVLIGNKFSPDEVVNDISPVPVLFIHGSGDRIIPAHHSQILYDKAEEPKQLWIIKDGNHTEAFGRYEFVYKKKLIEFYKDALKDKK